MAGVIVIVLFIAIAGFLVLLAIEPPPAKQRAREVKDKIHCEKEVAKAEIDAIAERHRRQVFDLIMQANRAAVEERAEKAQQHAWTVIAQAEKEI